MGIFDGQPVDAANSNPAWLDANADDVALGKIGFHNTDVLSGPNIDNTQRVQNRLLTATGVQETGSNGTTYGAPASTIADGDSHQLALTELANKFSPSSPPGHRHTGAAGDGPKVSADSLADYNDFWAVLQTNLFSSASGLSTDVSSIFTGFTPGGSTSIEGVVTDPSFNRVELRTSPAEDQIVNPTGGELVYGRLTFAASVWTLSFFYRDQTTGVETAYSLPTQNIRLYFRQVFKSGTRPTFDYGAGIIDSFDATADIVDATPTQPGRVSISAQSFGGVKTFVNDVDIQSSLALEKIDVASAATINQLTSASSHIKITGSTATQINGALGPSIAKLLLIRNATNQIVTIAHENVSALANDRFDLPNATNITIQAGSSATFIYDTAMSRWVVAAGSGSGGGVAFQEVVAGTVNGINNVFGPLTFSPSDSNSVLVMIDYMAVPITTGYTISGSTITFQAGWTPALGQTVYAFYLTQGTPSTPTMSGTYRVETRTITSGENTAKQLTLAFTPATPSYVTMNVQGGGAQFFGDDYTVSSNILSWSGLGLDGILTTGDKVQIIYVE